MGTPENNISSKIQKAAHLVGVSVYVFRVSTFQCQWLCFQPQKKRSSSKCNFYITLLQTGDDGNERFDRIVPNTGCNCSIYPPETDSSPDKGLISLHYDSAIHVEWIFFISNTVICSQLLHLIANVFYNLNTTTIFSYFKALYKLGKKYMPICSWRT